MDCKPIHAGSNPAAESIKTRLAHAKAEFWSKQKALQDECLTKTKHMHTYLTGFNLFGKPMYRCQTCEARFSGPGDEG